MKNSYSTLFLRISIGGLFLIMGIMKVLNTEKAIGMLSGLGFPAPEVFAWALILVEILCGAAIVVGFQMKYTAIPLALILVVVLILNPSHNINDWLKNAAILFAVFSLWIGKPGPMSL